MLEGILQGLFQWIYGMFLDLIAYCANALLRVMTTDLQFWETSVPVAVTLYQIFVAVGWGLLLGNCAFQAAKAMFAGFGFETESPVVLLLRTALFGTLLIFSKDICEIGLSIGKNVINLLGIPTSVTITFPDEGFFASIGASWLLVIIIGFILGIQIIKLFFEIAERYVVVAILTLLAPVGLAMVGSKSTKDICAGFLRTYASMIVMMVMNVLFLKLILSGMSTMPTGDMVLPWCLLIVGIAKVARKADNLISKIGLNPAITGDPLGHGRGGMIALMAIRSIIHTTSRAGKGKSGGGKDAGNSGAVPLGKNTVHSSVGGTNIGGSNSNSVEHNDVKTNTNSQNGKNVRNSQNSHFGAAGNTVNSRTAASSHFGSNSYENAKSTGSVSEGNVHFSSTGSTKVNKNRFGSSPSPTQSTKQTRNTLFTNKKAEAKPGIPKKEIPGVGVSPKRQSRNTSAGKPAGGGFRQNENPFKRSPDHSIGHFHMTAEPSDFQSRFGEVYIDESQPREEDSHGK